MRGRFITLEGGEGVGKSTQCALLGKALEARGLAVMVTREPGGTSGAEAIRALLLDGAHEWGARAECLLFAAARADHVAQIILPALDRGAWVICDRFVDSSRAYQGGEGGLSDADILAAHHVGSHGLLPDRTILLQAGEGALIERLRARDGDTSDRIGGRPADYHRKVAQRFGHLAAGESERFALVDAEGSPEAVHGRIMRNVASMLDGAR